MGYIINITTIPIMNRTKEGQGFSLSLFHIGEPGAQPGIYRKG